MAFTIYRIKSVASLDKGIQCTLLLDLVPQTTCYTGPGACPAVPPEQGSYPSKTIPINCRGRNTSKLILWSQNHPDTKTRQKHDQKGKLQTNITDEHRSKNPQQAESTNTLKGSYIVIKWDLSQECKDGSVSEIQSMWCIHHINELKSKHSIFISIHIEKLLRKFNTHLW